MALLNRNLNGSQTNSGGNGGANRLKSNAINPNVFCRLGHYNFLLGNRVKGKFFQFVVILYQLLNISPLLALSAYQRYLIADKNHWKVSND